MLRVLRQFVHVVQNYYDPHDMMRLIVSQEIEAFGPPAKAEL
jgi:hypothetical protein